jgi:hypothetical protein
MMDEDVFDRKSDSSFSNDDSDILDGNSFK